MSTDLATMQSRDLVRKPTSDVVDIVQHLADFWDLGKMLIESGMIPKSVKHPGAAVAIILKGRELGLGPMASFDLITVIQGKPGVSPQGMLALINQSGLSENIKIWDDGEAAFCTMKRKGQDPHTERFGMDDARVFKTTEWQDGGGKKEIPLSQKSNWLSQPRTMRKWRVVAACARIVYPDVVAGLYTPDELGAAVNEEGEMVDPAAPPPGQKFPDQGGPGRSGSYASEDHDAAFKAMLVEAGSNLKGSWGDAWASANQGEFPVGLPEMPVRSHEVIMELYNTAVIGGLLKPVETVRDENTGQIVPKASIEQLRKMVAILFGKDPAGVRRSAGRFMERRAMQVALDFAQANPAFSLPDDFNPEFNILDDGPAPEDESQEAPEPLPVVEAPKKLGKKELAEQVRLRLEAEKKAKAAQTDRGDAYEEPEPALAN